VRRAGLLAAVVALGIAGGAAARAQEIVVVARQASGTLVWRGTATRLGPARLVPGAAFATLSQDGSRLATATALGGGRLEIRVRPVAGGAGRLIGRWRAAGASLAFSPDGARLAYASPRGIELAALTSPGRRPLELPLVWRRSTYSSLAFSPDGTVIAFTRTWGDGRKGTLRSELDAAGVDGRSARRLYRVRDPFSDQARPAFAPDGRRIAFAVERSVYTVAVDGGPATRLTTPPPRSGDGDPVYSPDGAWLAFPRTPSYGTSDVYAVRADGTGLRRLTTTPIPPRGEPHTGSSPLAWSPDGTRMLAFRHDRFAVVDVASRRSTDLRRTGVLYPVGPARWPAG
jgi:TolB protein